MVPIKKIGCALVLTRMSQSSVGALVLFTEAAAPAGDKTQQSNHYFYQVNQPVITI